MPNALKKAERVEMYRLLQVPPAQIVIVLPSRENMVLSIYCVYDPPSSSFLPYVGKISYEITFLTDQEQPEQIQFQKLLESIKFKEFPNLY